MLYIWKRFPEVQAYRLYRTSRERYLYADVRRTVQQSDENILLLNRCSACCSDL